MDIEAIKKMNIYEKMLHISDEIKPLKRDLAVEQGNGKSYSALSERAVLDAIKPLESKYRIFSYPCNRIRHSQLLKKEYLNQDGFRRVVTLLLDRIDVTYRFINVDNPNEIIDVNSFGIGIDTGDKGPGKGMTYADKYALMKAYKICAEDSVDDPDKNASPSEAFAGTVSDFAPVVWDQPQENHFPTGNGVGDVWMPPGVVAPQEQMAQNEAYEPQQMPPVPQTMQAPQSMPPVPQTMQAPQSMPPVTQQVPRQVPPVPQTMQAPQSMPPVTQQVPRQVPPVPRTMQAPQQMQVEPQQLWIEPPAPQVGQAAMSVDDAKSFVIPIGTMKGKTIGELLAIDRRQVEFYAGDKFRNSKYPELKVAAQCALQSMAE